MFSREETHEELQQYDMFSREETHEELQHYDMFSREETHEELQHYDMFSSKDEKMIDINNSETNIIMFSTLSRNHVVML
jgi:hypothetical protein